MAKMVTPDAAYFWVPVAVAALGLLWAIWQSKRETPDMKQV